MYESRGGCQLTEIEKGTHGFWKPAARVLDAKRLTDFGVRGAVPGRDSAMVGASVVGAG
jgi:hypothetical protein